jgi:hypothetical protein
MIAAEDCCCRQTILSAFAASRLPKSGLAQRICFKRIWLKRILTNTRCVRLT